MVVEKEAEDKGDDDIDERNSDREDSENLGGRRRSRRSK